MKRQLVTILAVGAFATGSYAFAQGQDAAGPGRGKWHHRGNPLDHLTTTLKLTPDQQAKVQPILDQARPQIVAIHQDAMQKTKAVMDKTMAQIRPLLTPDQQKKADDLQQAHQELHTAMKKLRDAKSE